MVYKNNKDRQAYVNLMLHLDQLEDLTDEELKNIYRHLRVSFNILFVVEVFNSSAQSWITNVQSRRVSVWPTSCATVLEPMNIEAQCTIHAIRDALLSSHG